MPYLVEPMQLADIAEVAAIERQSFTTPWPVYAYRRELKENRNSRYFVVRWVDPTEGGTGSGGRPEAPQSQSGTVPAGKSPEQSGSAVRRAVARLLPFWKQEPQGVRRPAEHKGPIVAYAGLWIVLDEGHITTIAVRPDRRGQGLGELLLVRLIETAQQMGAERVTLEVRVSNEVAQGLYRKYGFRVEGVRRRYYSDDNEDANVMWSDPISTPEFQAHFATLRSTLYQRLGDNVLRADVA